MDHYLVWHEYTCPVCNGEKEYHNEQWIEAMNVFDDMKALAKFRGESDHDATEMAFASMYQFWANEGYHNPSRLPPEFCPCGECEGAGIIRKEVELLEALSDLGLKLEYKC